MVCVCACECVCVNVCVCVRACVRARVLVCEWGECRYSSNYTISQERMVSVSLSSVSMKTLSSFFVRKQA